MRESKGFTLVELLAVIVILAIILAIAIPSITNVVNSSRLSSFAVSSKMLERAAKTYLSVNNTAVASGTTSYILYSDMKSAGYINKVVDPQSNTECTHSGVYVTNTSGTYTYKGALACDNYMDIDAYNLITNSDFSNGTTGWTVQGGSASISNNILSVTGAGSSSRIDIVKGSTFPATIGHIFYMRCRERVSGSGGTRLYFVTSLMQGNVTYKSENGPAVLNPVSGNWYNLSKSFAIPSTPTGIDTQQPIILVDFPDAATANGKVMEVDGNMGIYTFDLTAIYGSGNEPTATQMDNIMTNMGK